MRIEDSTATVRATFRFIPPIEFFTALYRTANVELFTKKRRDGASPMDDPLETLVQTMLQRLSPFLQRELKFFFSIRDLMVNQAFHQFAFMNPRITTIEELIAHVDTTDPSTILTYMCEDIPESETRLELVEFIERGSLGSSIHWSERLSRFLTSDEGERIAECLANPTETKMRFMFLLRGFYKDSFQPFETQLFNSSQTAIPVFEEVFSVDPNRFFKTLVQGTPNTFKKDLYVHVSAMNPYGISSTLTDEARIDVPDYLRLGVQTRERLNEESVEDLVESFTKAISDKRRLEILHLLTKKPMYAQEIANILQLTSAAVAHHMAFFFKLDLVYFEKQHNKVYYDLDKKRLAELLRILTTSLLPSSESDS